MDISDLQDLDPATALRLALQDDAINRMDGLEDYLEAEGLR